MKKTYDTIDYDESQDWRVWLRYLDTTGTILSRKDLTQAWDAFDKAVAAEQEWLKSLGITLENAYPDAWFYTMHDVAHSQWNGDGIAFKTQAEQQAFIDLLKLNGYVHW